MIRYSVVIPVYNAAEYIEASALSIINQSYKNIELLLINDASTDNSEEVIKALMEKYPDFPITYKKVPHGGPSSARNKGIELATGDYICFLDSDDTYEPDLFEKLAAKNNDFDICYFGWKEIDTKGNVFSIYSDNYTFTDTPLTGIDAAKRKYYGSLWLCNCNEIYRLKMIRENNLHYPEGIYSGEDTYFIYTCLLNAEKVICLKENSFINLYRDDSLMHSSFSKNSITEITSLTRLIEYAHTNNYDKDILDMFYTLLIYSKISIFKKITRAYKWYQYNSFRKFYHENVPIVSESKKYTLRWNNKKKKIEYILYSRFRLIFFLITKTIYNLKEKKLK